MFIRVNGGEISKEELEAYQNRGIAKYGARLKGVEVEIPLYHREGVAKNTPPPCIAGLLGFSPGGILAGS